MGRDAELAACQKAFAEAAEHQVTLRIVGESGVGKSALAHQFALRLAETDPRAIVLRGRCYERESVPFKAVDGIVDALSDVLIAMPLDEVAEILPPDARLLAQVFPVLARVPAIDELPASSRDRARVDALRGRLFAAMRALFVALADRRRVAIVIDDLQWSDADSLALLRALLLPPDPPRLLLLATLRSGSQILSTEAAGAEVALPGDSRELHLYGLPVEEARALAERLLAGDKDDAASRARARAIAEAAGGHPLFIDELVRHARSSVGASGGAARRRDRRARGEARSASAFDPGARGGRGRPARAHDRGGGGGARARRADARDRAAPGGAAAPHDGVRRCRASPSRVARPRTRRGGFGAERAPRAVPRSRAGRGAGAAARGARRGARSTGGWRWRSRRAARPTRRAGRAKAAKR